MSAAPGCMGGWCPARDRCAQYLFPTPGIAPSERLCPPGDVHPVPVWRPVLRAELQVDKGAQGEPHGQTY